MKTPFALILMLLSSLLVACGPSQVELDATSTQIAANIFATQTAEAPTTTPTFTLAPSPTPTSTPIPTVTPTPGPDLVKVVLKLEDLPPGFESVPPDEYNLQVGASFITGGTIDDSFAFSISTEDFEIIAGAMTLLPKRLEQAEFDSYVPDIPNLLFTVAAGLVGAGDTEESEDLPGLEGIGDIAAGVSSVFRGGGPDVRWDVIIFRRGQVGVLAYAFYLDGDTPIVAIADASRLIDSRIIEILGIFGCEDAIGCVDIEPDEPIHVAFMLPVTGPVQSLGVSAKNAIELALEKRGQIHGHDIELTGEDSLCSAEGGRTAAQRIATVHTIIGVIGTTCSSAMVGAMSTIGDSGLITISPSNTSPMLTDPDQVWQAGYFRTAHNDKLQGILAARFAYEELGARSAAAIHDGDPYTQGLVQAFADTFVDLGGTVTAIEAVRVGFDDGPTILAAIGTTAPDVLYFPIFQPEGGSITAQSAGVPGLENTALMSSDALMVSSFAPSAGEAAIGMYLSGPHLSGPKSDAYLADYTDRFGAPPQAPFSEHAYDAINILLDAIEKVAIVGDDGTLHIGRQALRDAVAATSGYDGITGNLTCSRYGDCASGEALAIFQITSAQVAAEDNFPPPAIYTP